MNWRTLFTVLLLSCGGITLFADSPLQPFLVELLAQERGKWTFVHPLGSSLSHPGPVSLRTALPAERAGSAVLRLDAPEFPGEPAHAVYREFPAKTPGRFELDVPGFSATLTLKSVPGGGSVGALSGIKLGSAVKADRIPAALYVTDGGKKFPVLLDGFKLQSDRIGHVFTGDEPLLLHLIRPGGGALEADYTVTDYFRNRQIGRGRIKLAAGETAFSVPLKPYGSFTVTVELPGSPLQLRVTRIPEPLDLAPEDSFVGMNIFQQQIRYYSYQLPLFAKAGVRHIRPWLAWENTWTMQQPHSGVFDTSQLDALLRRLALHGQKYTYLLYGFSPVLNLPSTEKSALNAKQMRLWRDYVKRIVAHCRSVDDWEVWNEPDLLSRDSDFTAEFYREFLKETSRAIRETNPSARVHGISLAGNLDWLRKVCKGGGAAGNIDIVTLHDYTPPQRFLQGETGRQEILDKNGFLGKTQFFNEIGSGGFDGNPAYTAAYPGTTEREQAERLAVTYALALHVAGPGGKAYWFCSLDPRDSTRKPHWNFDSAFGLLYLGGQPKIAYAALAGMARMLDGNECLGHVAIADSPVRYVAFSGERAVVWSDSRKGEIEATALGCRPDEELTIRDLFGNPVDQGKAANLTLKLNDGPRFLFGSGKLSETAAESRKAWMEERRLAAEAETTVNTLPVMELEANEKRSFEFTMPPGSRAIWSETPEFPAGLRVRTGRDRVSGEITAGNGAGAGVVKFTFRLPSEDMPEVTRWLPVDVGRRSFIRGGSFFHDLREFCHPGVRVEAEGGVDNSGCLRLGGPFRGRIHHPEQLPMLPGRPLRFKAMLKGRLSPDVRLSFHAAMFSGGHWAGTWRIAALGEPPLEGKKYPGTTLPLSISPDGWHEVSAELPADRLPGKDLTLIFYIDVNGGEAADWLLIDNLELYQ